MGRTAPLTPNSSSSLSPSPSSRFADGRRERDEGQAKPWHRGSDAGDDLGALVAYHRRRRSPPTVPGDEEAGRPDGGASLSRPFANTVTFRSLRAAADTANAQSRERMRQALALKTATDALSLAAAARQRRRGLDGGSEESSSQRQRQQGRQGMRVDAMEYPVPDEGGVSAAEYSSLEHSLIKGGEGQREEQRRWPAGSLDGITPIHPAEAERILSNSW